MKCMCTTVFLLNRSIITIRWHPIFRCLFLFDCRSYCFLCVSFCFYVSDYGNIYCYDRLYSYTYVEKDYTCLVFYAFIFHDSSYECYVNSFPYVFFLWTIVGCTCWPFFWSFHL